MQKFSHPLVAVIISALTLPAVGMANSDIEKLPADQVPKIKAPSETPHGQKPLRVKVLALYFNPFIPGNLHSPDDADTKPKSIQELGGWNDPLPLTAGYIQDMCDASGGLLQYEIVEWLTVRRFQKKVDGYTYTPEAYMQGLRAGTGRADAWHRPDGLDYPHMIKEFDIVRRVESGEIDEVWMFGAPYFGYYETCMAGKDAFWINGKAFTEVPSNRRFVIAGFNYERGVAEMIHNMTHRAESTMSRIYGGWKVDQLTNNWAKFAANEHQSGTAAVGTCHYPPNGEKDYDYANERFVESTADDWKHFPDLQGRSRKFNREEWAAPHKNRNGNPDYHRNFQIWWWSHLPKAPGVNEDGRVNNWWEYLYNFNAYDERGKALPDVQPATDSDAEKQGYRRPA